MLSKGRPNLACISMTNNIISLASFNFDRSDLPSPVTATPSDVINGSDVCAGSIGCVYIVLVVVVEMGVGRWLRVGIFRARGGMRLRWCVDKVETLDIVCEYVLV